MKQSQAAKNQAERTALKRRLSSLTATQRVRLAARVAEKKSRAKASLDTISPAEPLRVETAPGDSNGRAQTRIYPAGPGQTQMWFLQCYAPESPTYNVPFAFHLCGPLDTVKLETAFRSIIQRHDTLRTTFSMEESGLVQRVAESSNFRLERLNLADVPLSDRNAATNRWIQELAGRPFNLSAEAQIRAHLLEFEPEEHVLVVVLHHINSDGWSRSNLCQELSALYSAALGGAPATLPELPIRFADYCGWREERSKDLAEQTAYWTKQLAGEFMPLDWGSDRRRTKSPSLRGDRFSVRIETELWNAVKERARIENVTPFMILLTAFEALLYRCTGQKDMRVGIPIANRQRIETEMLIGLFINTLILRTPVSGEITFRELLQRVRATALDAYANSDTPFENLVEMLADRNGAYRTPLIQTLFTVRDFPVKELSLPGLEITSLPVTTGTAKVDFSLGVDNSADGWSATVEYDTDLFTREQAEDLLRQWLHLLTQIAEDVTRRISEYSLVTGQTMATVPDPAIALAEPSGLPVIRQFGAISEAVPANPAIQHNGRSWTYHQLDSAAERIAKQLVTSGVKPGDVVVVSGFRCFGLIAGILAVLRARAILLLIDTSLPSKRQDYMVTEAAPKHRLCVIAENPGKSENASAALDAIPSTGISGDGLILHSLGKPGGEAVTLPVAAPEDAAYIFFTSGTTGNPKAVVGDHKGLSHFIDWERETLRVVETDRVAQVTAFSFDPILRDIFLPLTSGATLCLPDADTIRQGDQFVSWLQRESISILHAVPSLADAWLEGVSADSEVPSLRWVLFAGEALSGRFVSRWRKQIGDRCRIMNLYGTTETTLAKCFYILPEKLFSEIQPIGHPLPCTQVLVIKRNNQLCGIGERGEIAIRTPFRTRGYLNASESDRARFAPNPFRNDSSDLIYWTGDIGAFDSDGKLLLFGRSDDQLKIRGARVEPAEITAALGEHSAIRRSAVIVRENPGGNRQLVAYVVPFKKSALPAGRDLRSFLSQKLPDYMIPSRFVSLRSLPLMTNGKLDRAALARTDGTELDNGSEYVAPRNPYEMKLARIWKELLHRNRIGVHDNFFDLGGHSLLTMQAASRIRKTLGMELPLRMLFEFPTIAELAEKVASLTDAPALNASDRHRILVDWNRTEREYPRNQCIHQLFEQQVKRRPDAIALEFKDQSLTYRELNQRANQAAHALRKFGVGPDSLVGLFLERSPEMIIGLLGVLKAGGAYVPFDPAHPRERLEFMLLDARPKVLLTSSHLAPGLSVDSIPTICLDQFRDTSGTESPENTGGAGPHNLAYVIYTSGSTGRPKGVLIEHRSLVNYIVAAIQQFHLGPGDRFLQFASLSFDQSAEEIYSCLISGATLVLRTGEMTQSPDIFLDSCRALELTVLHLPTAYWSHLTAQMEMDAGQLPSQLRLVIIGGEKAGAEALLRWRQKFGDGVPLFNTYGPTETTIVATWCELTIDAKSRGEVPIGRPIPNTTAYVLDDHLQPVPIGVIGELFVGGDAVGRGYLNRPELTAERFIPNPFVDDCNARLYRTGDRVRYRTDGLLEYHGRLDQQVKIRGYRIEPGEIESVLSTHPSVGTAAVISRFSKTGEQELVGFVVARDSNQLSIASLREWLTTKLPEYMIPSRFAVRSALPLTINGKIDRTALAQMETTDAPVGDSYVPPRNELERSLARIWESVLERPQIGIRDNFFHLGGHSLRAVIINSRMASLLRVDTPLRWLFEHPTIEGLAGRLASEPVHRKSSRAISKADRTQPLPMSFGQQGMWLLQQLLPDPATYNVSYVWRLRGPVDRFRLRRCLNKIVERHEVLRTALQVQAGELVQQIIEATDIAVPWQETDLSALSREQRESFPREMLIEKIRRPFDLDQAPLWRAEWIALDENEHILAFTFHHSIVDEWSIRLFADELTQLYRVDGKTELANLPGLPVQYADFAVWQRDILTAQILEKSRRYWREQLDALPPPLNLRPDLSPSAQPSGRGGVVRFDLPEPVANKLRGLAQQERTTLFRLMLAMFHVWLHQSTGQTDIVVGTPVSRRTRTELQSLLGFFLNTLPIRVKLNEGATFRHVLTQVRETVFGALSHAGLPFEQMVKIALKERGQERHPIYQAMFVFIEGPRPSVDIEGVDTQWEPVTTGTCKNDLTLSIRAVKDCWACVLEYSADLFSSNAADAMACSFTKAVESIAENVDNPISGLSGAPLTRSDRLPGGHCQTAPDDRRENVAGAIEKAYPLAPMQQGMLFHHLLEPESGVYVEQLVCTLREKVDVAKLGAAWQRLVTRHSILRTSFHWKDVEVPFQEVHGFIELPFTSSELQGSTPNEQDKQFKGFLKLDRQRGFVMDRAPLFRLALLERNQAHFELVWTIHHALLDGRTMALLLEEAFAFYDASLRGEEIDLPIPRPYSDFIDWLQTRSLDKARRFWQEYLAGFSSPIQVNLPSPSCSIESEEELGDERTFVDQATTARLKEIARANDLTLNTLVQAAWAFVLHQYSGYRDIVFGAIRACSHCIEGSEKIIGPLFNTVPIRTRIDPVGLILPWLRELRSQWVGMREFESTPLSEAQRGIQTGGQPLFDTLVVFDKNLWNKRFQALGDAWRNRQVDVHSKPSYVITASGYGGDELCLQLQFDGRRFDSATVRRMLGYFRAVVEGLAAYPEGRLRDLPRMPGGDQQGLQVDDWNQTQQDFPHNKCVHQLFEEQVERTPAAQAIAGEDFSISYSELNSRANRLAYYLRSQGVGPDVPVGLCLEPSSELLVALLAVLKAGGAYVPMDPTLPPQRLNFLLQNSACGAVVTRRAHLPKLPETNGATAAPFYVLLDDPLFPNPPEQTANPDPLATPHHLAYIMYTSGSTGWPKGVEMPHQPLVNMLAWQCATSTMTVGRRTVQFASLSFDVSFQEIFSTWIGGGTLVLIADDIRRDPAALLHTLTDAKIERAFLPVIVLERMAEVAERECVLPEHLKEVLVAGEPLRITPNIRRLFDRISGCRLWNHYGPTETHVVTAHELIPPASNWPERPVIGRPLANCQIYLLDEDRNPVPIGSQGELYVGGICLSRGYRQRPDLTADRFIRHSFGSDPDARVYRTGDICRWLPDGQLDFVGRSDHQIKIRGYRVELGEIENAFCEMEGVREAVVVTRGNDSGEKWLVGYVAADRETADESKLKAALIERLPDYMIPAQIEFLDALPVNSHGKVDRSALPKPLGKRSGNKAAALPRTLLELELTRVWQKLFDRKDIGRHDNFFALGGYSLLAARLALEIEKLLGRKLPIAALFQSPTIESLVQRLSGENWAPAWSSLVPVQPLGSRPPFFFAHGWGGDVYAARLLADGFAPDQPIYGLQAVGLDGSAARHTTVEEMAQHYVREIRSYQPEGPYHVGGYSMGGLVALEIAQQLCRAGQKVAFVGLLDTSPTSAPWTEFAQGLAPYLWERLRFHVRRWWNMPARERMDYVRRCWTHLRWWIRRNRAKPAAVTSARTKNGSLDENIGGYGDYYWAVAAAYQVRRYPGRIDVFYSESAHPGMLSFWRHLARRGAILHRVPGTHLEIIKPHNLPALTNALKASLRRAQEDPDPPR